MTVTEAIEARRSVHSYDPSKSISDAELRELIELSTLAPSSFNLNHWRFITVRSDEGKKRLYATSFNQQHILDASAVLIVLGKIDAHEDVERFSGDWVSKGYFADGQHLKIATSKFYGPNPIAQRDEAIRSTSIMIGMMMLAAKERGFDTSAIIGFKPDEVVEAFNIPSNFMPVMLLTVGHELTPPPERVIRLDYNEIVHQEIFRED